jgi:hypothetical protein
MHRQAETRATDPSKVEKKTLEMAAAKVPGRN